MSCGQRGQSFDLVFSEVLVYFFFKVYVPRYDAATYTQLDALQIDNNGLAIAQAVLLQLLIARRHDGLSAIGPRRKVGELVLETPERVVEIAEDVVEVIQPKVAHGRWGFCGS